MAQVSGAGGDGASTPKRRNTIKGKTYRKYKDSEELAMLALLPAHQRRMDKHVQRSRGKAQTN